MTIDNNISALKKYLTEKYRNTSNFIIAAEYNNQNIEYINPFAITYLNYAKSTGELFKTTIHHLSKEKNNRTYETITINVSDIYSVEVNFKISIREYKGVKYFFYEGKVVNNIFNKYLSTQSPKDYSKYKKDKLTSLLLENSKDTYWISDTEGIIKYTSGSITKLTGYRPDDYVGKSLFEIDIDENSKAYLFSLLKHTHELEEQGIKNDELTRFELKLKRPDGSSVWTDIIVNAVRDDNGNLIELLGVTREIEEKKRIEARLNHVNNILFSLREINKLITGEKNKEDLLSKACTILTETRGYYESWIILVDENQKPTRYISSEYSDNNDYLNEYLTKNNLPECMKVVLEDTTNRVHNTSGYCNTCGLHEHHNINNSFASKLYYEDRIFGIISISIDENYSNESEELNLFNEVVKDLSYAIYNLGVKERKLIALKKLKENEELYRTIVNNVADIIIYAERLTGNILFANNAAFSKYGYNENEFAGLQLTDIERDNELGKLSNLDINTEKGKFTYTAIHKAKSGETFTAEIHVTQIELFSEQAFVLVIRDTTKHKEYVKKIESLSTRLSLAIKSAKLGVWDMNIVTGYMEWDEKMYQIYGVEKNQFESNYEAWQNVVHPEDLARANQEVQDSIENGTEFNTEFRIIRPDGKHAIISAFATVLYDHDNNPIRMIGVNNDITKRRVAEKKLFENQKKFRTFFSAINDAVFVHRYSEKEYLNFMEVNDFACKRYEYSRTEFLKLTVLDIAADPKKMHELKNTIFNDPEIMFSRPTIFETVHKTKSGEAFPVEINTSMLQLNGEYVFLSVVRDLTERKLVTSEMEALSAKLSIAIKSANIGIWEYIVDEDKFIFNEVMAELYELNSSNMDEINQKFMLDMVYPEDKERMLNSLFGDNNAFSEAFRIVTPKGNIKHLKSYGTIIHDKEGNIIKAIGATIDETESKLQEKLILENEEKLLNILQNNTQTFTIIDQNFNIKHYNDKAAEYVLNNYGKHIYTGTNIFTLIPEGQKKDVKDILNRTFNHERVEITLPNRENGKLRWYSFLYYPVEIEEDKVTGICISSIDITSIKNSELELKKAKEKAEAADRLKSEFLAQMSHEIRTPVGAMMSFAQILKTMSNTEDEDAKEIFSGIESSGKRIIRTINMILNVSELQTGAYDFIKRELNIVDDVLLPLKREFKYQAELKNITLDVFSKEDFTITVDEYSVIQIFANIVDNAIKYTEKGYVSIYCFKNEEEQVVVEVSDTGIGISKQFLKHLFQPFAQEEHGYSRRFDGTGLGLTLVKEYCNMNNATISVQSIKNKGTTFTITFISN